jgi:hypothetical protein
MTERDAGPVPSRQGLLKQELLNAEEVARILGTTPQAIRVAIANRRSHLIPPSFTLGRRRVWLRRAVFCWLNRQANKQQPQPYRRRPAVQIPRITIGLELVDDEGDEVVVTEVDPGEDAVTLEASDGEQYSMSLRNLRSRLRDGDFACLVDDGADEAEAAA